MKVDIQSKAEKQRIAHDKSRVEQLMRDPAAVFVFGSNAQGVHGAGAARTAMLFYGALQGRGEGMQGRSYAIPTKVTWQGPARTLSQIQESVHRLVAVAVANPKSIFAVTRIGCGLAGFTDEQIAPLFHGAPENLRLPFGWFQIASMANPSRTPTVEGP